MTLFERVFGGNDYNYVRTVAAIDEAIAAYGESEPVSFPGTAYSLPCYYGVTGVKITTLDYKEPKIRVEAWANSEVSDFLSKVMFGRTATTGAMCSIKTKKK